MNGVEKFVSTVLRKKQEKRESKSELSSFSSPMEKSSPVTPPAKPETPKTPPEAPEIPQTNYMIPLLFKDPSIILSSSQVNQFTTIALPKEVSSLKRCIYIVDQSYLPTDTNQYYSLLFENKIQLTIGHRDRSASRSWFNGQFLGIFLLIRFYEEILMEGVHRHILPKRICYSQNRMIWFEFEESIPSPSQWSDFCQFFSNKCNGYYIEITLPTFTTQEVVMTLFKRVYCTNEMYSDLGVVDVYIEMHICCMIIINTSFLVRNNMFPICFAQFMIVYKMISGMNDSIDFQEYLEKYLLRFENEFYSTQFDKNMLDLYLDMTKYISYSLPTSPKGIDCYLVRLKRKELHDYLANAFNLNGSVPMLTPLALSSYIVIFKDAQVQTKSTWKRAKEEIVKNLVSKDYFVQQIQFKNQDPIRLRDEIERQSNLYVFVG